ncbi:urea ABC transporter permease subunit UrtB [Enterovibrio norvegicus]|uniref:Urea ABC transporter permease subunit UrtB n=1 Tax=Enterovibrio norvegicus TaxID=188144 RepID=A0A2N7LGM3_9GAMM|nr:urea ABC transporter permease subunit UrtB [Enterovibrio norvegicus]PMN94708.1 urea ABC transporter permease subunit UrtB [Enterovibrio norvegicus]
MQLFASIKPLPLVTAFCFLCLITALLFVKSVSANADISHSSVVTLEDISPLLTSKKFSEKYSAVGLVANSELAQKQQILEGLLNKQIVYKKSDKSLWFLAETPLKKGSQLAALSDGREQEVTKKRDYRAVSLNNKMRSEIRTQLATLSLLGDDLDAKRDGAKRLLGGIDSALAERLPTIIKNESDAVTKNTLIVALGISTLTDKSSKTDDKIQAVATLEESGLPDAYEALQSVSNLNPKDSELGTAITRALASFEEKQRVVNVAQTLYFGLSLGSVLVLAGIGLAITFGVMGVINMAHGELIMIGAYTTYVLQQLMPAYTGMSLLLSIPCAFVVSGLVGILIERTVIRHLYGRPLETLLATFGISLILQQAVRSIFSPLNRSVSTPEFMSGMIDVTPMLQLTASRAYIIIFCLMVFFALLFVLRKTPLGLQVRAVSQNRPMARAMGVRSEWVDMATFGLGAGVAGIAGVALSQLTNVGPNMGQAYIIDSFMVVVFGGVGNLWGTLAAGLSLGVFNKILEPWAGAVLSKILVLVFIILFIQKRPKGLFPQRGRMAEG